MTRGSTWRYGIERGRENNRFAKVDWNKRMALNCQHCGVKLFGEEVPTGVCEHCRDRPTPNKDLGARVASSRLASADGRRVAWRWVRLGLRFLIVGALCNLVYIIGVVAGPFLLFVAHSEFAVAWGTRGAGGLGAILHVAGVFLCCAVPRASGLRVRAGAVILFALLLVVTVIAVVVLLCRRIDSFEKVPEFLKEDGDGRLMLVAVVLLGAASAISLFVLLSGVAQTQRDKALARKFLLFPAATFCVVFAVSLLVVVGVYVITGNPLLGESVNVYVRAMLILFFTLYLIGMYQELRELLSPPD